MSHGLSAFRTIAGRIACAALLALLSPRGADHCMAAESENIAPAVATLPAGNVAVQGQPRVAQGHPCTMWDAEDVARLKKQLAVSPLLQAEYARLQQEMDRRIAQPLGVPDPGPVPTRDTYHAHAANAHAISDLGTMYVLSGDAKYGEFCRRMLVAYAQNYPRYAHPAGWVERRYRSAQDGRLTGQFLEDGGWLIQVARGYDLVHDLPTWTAAERTRIRDDLFEAIAAEFVADVLGKDDYLGQSHNRSVICNCGVLLAGYASDDPQLINYGLYGKNGTQAKPTGGVFGAHFGPQCIDVDGMWNEGAMGYQFMALGALINDAETLWRHGMDLYRYRNAALKGLFDSPLGFAYPDFTLPATHDSGRASLLLSWYTDCHHCYEYGYLRYGEPKYLAIVDQTRPHLQLSIHQGPTSVLFDRHPERKVAVPCRSVNFPGVGYGILRVPAAQGTASLLMEYGPSRSHGHPSKLGLDLFAQGDVLLPDPGVIFPYDAPLDTKWYWTSPGHNVLTVDEKPQIYGGNRWKFPRNLPDPEARQTVFGLAETLGIQRGMSSSVYPGVTLDRAVFLTPQYVADLHSAVSSAPHKYDLGWHLRGTLNTELPLTPWAFPEPVEPGYNALCNVRHAQTAQAWSAIVTGPHHVVRLLAAGGTPTEVIAGDGYYHVDRGDEKTPALFQRRLAASTLFGNVVDIAGEKPGFVKSVVQQGGPDAGYGLLQVETTAGTDWCFAAYGPGKHKLDALSTDAQQAFVRTAGDAVQALYLGGGTMLKAGDAELWRKTPGLAFIERLSSGSYVLSNPSPSAAGVAVKLAALAEAPIWTLDADGKRAGPAAAKASPDGLRMLQLPGGGKVEFAAPGKH